MRSWIVVFVLAWSAAIADPKPPDLIFTWTEGEMSKDMSIWTTTITVTGDRLHYARKYSGRNSGFPGTKGTELDATVKDPKKVAAALAALDKLKAKPAKKLPPERMNMREGCVRRGKAERCATASGSEPDSDELKAIIAVREALLDGVKLP
jgi:hypothetical protein